MLRSIGAVLVGYFIVAASIMVFFFAQQQEPDAALMLFSIGYGFCVAVAGGFFTAVIAKHHELQHGAGLAVLISAMGITGLFIEQNLSPLWYQISNIIAGILGALCGAYMRQGKGSRVNDVGEW